MLTAPGTLYVALMVLGPAALAVAYSFWTQTYVTLDRTPTLANFREIATDPLYRTLILRSVIVAGLVTFLTVLLAYPVAYYIAFHVYRRKALWLLLVSIPFWTSYLLRVFSWKLVLGYNGVLNSALIWLGVIDKPLEWILFDVNAVVLTLTHAWAPFAILPIFVSLEKIDRSLLEAAKDLGEGPFRAFFRVVLPLSMPGVIGATLIIFIPTVGDYVTPALVGGSEGAMVANLIQVQFGKANNWPLGAALAICAMLCVTIAALAAAALLRFLGRRIR